MSGSDKDELSFEMTRESAVEAAQILSNASKTLFAYSSTKPGDDKVKGLAAQVHDLYKFFQTMAAS